MAHRTDGSGKPGSGKSGSGKAGSGKAGGGKPGSGETQPGTEKRQGARPATPGEVALGVYEAELFRLQAELVALQEWVRSTGARVLVIFEGRDAAGKGSAIKRLTEYLNPRLPASWRCRHRPSGSGVNGISSATCSTCPPRGRSS